MYIALEMYDLYASLAGCRLDGAVSFAVVIFDSKLQYKGLACETVTYLLLVYESPHTIILFMDCNCECGHHCMWSPLEVSQLPVKFCFIKSTLHL